ncbi:hypothetical protein BC792_10144 [Sphingobacterium allocomposti]|uniref:Uncharacterized protein n=1 Tax=Sphingobacterium allocomposti TaxID=415956 RepID=A0A5S5DR08_9SPHI|nr:hypothetical protein [Sphingobacterium composti Yoo et al. 2007 non Ten et al. 2007]TYP98390.1 hypothetical protein BC792_10144 [Sphingobacterium composti Yoo et al. 2007 non Ten et al. 2007]
MATERVSEKKRVETGALNNHTKDVLIQRAIYLLNKQRDSWNEKEYQEWRFIQERLYTM